MRILVTGNQGYIGTVMTQRFAEAGHEVVGLDTGFYENCWLGKPIDPKVSRQIKKDIRDVDQSDFSGIDGVVHLAALSNDPTGELNPGLTEDINFEATMTVAQAAKAAGVERFIFASSCSIYGAGGKDALTEEDEFNPLTAYAKSKVASEFGLRDLADDSFSPTFMRNGTVYGFSPRLRVDLVVNNLTGWALTTGQVKLLSDGRAWRPMLHIEDFTQAFRCALEAPRERVHNQAMNVGTESENYMVRDMAEFVQQVVPNSSVSFGEGAGADTRNYNVSFAKIREILPEFQPQWTVPKGAEQVYRGCVDAGMDNEAFMGRLYTRLKQLQHLIDGGLVDDRLFWRVSAGVGA